MTLFLFGTLFCLLVRLLSHFLVINFRSSLASLSLRFAALHTHYRVLLTTFCGIQNLFLGICPTRSTFLDLVSNMSLAIRLSSR